MKIRRPRSSGLITALSALALTADGGSSGHSSSNRGGGSALAFATCMRERGVMGFTDPGAGGSLNLAGIDTSSPSFQSASQKCAAYAPGGPSQHGLSAAQVKILLTLAERMRVHGVSKFPDPGGRRLHGPPPGINPGAPAFRQAAAACGDPGLWDGTIGGKVSLTAAPPAG